MEKKVITLPLRRATPEKTVSAQRVEIRLGKQLYALDITCQASLLPLEARLGAINDDLEPGPDARLQVNVRFVFLG